MHIETHCSREEYLDDLHSRSYRNEHRAVCERYGAGHRRSAAGNSQWVFGNLFECHSDSEECAHGRIPFGGIYYCVWPLKDKSADYHHKPPCSWDEEHG